MQGRKEGHLVKTVDWDPGAVLPLPQTFHMTLDQSHCASDTPRTMGIILLPFSYPFSGLSMW